MSGQLQGKVALITGASEGFGAALAARYVAAGASVVLCARNAEKLEAVRRQVTQAAGADQFVEAVSGDVAEAATSQVMVERALALGRRVDILVNNAGVYGPMGLIEEVDWAAWVEALRINIEGSVLTARAVLPAMKAQRSGKIIQLSGGGATNPMPRISAYAVSKAAIVRFVESLAQEVEEFGIAVNAIAPGALNTRMLEEVLAAGPDKVGPDFFARSLEQKRKGGAGFEAGMNLAVFLASAASDGITGRLISALWDRWEQWPEHREALAQSDLYTLRRITGRDRGQGWGDK